MLATQDALAHEDSHPSTSLIERQSVIVRLSS